MNKRVLFLAETLGIPEAPAHLYNLAAGLREQGFEVGLAVGDLAQGAGGGGSQIKAQCAPIYEIPALCDVDKSARTGGLCETVLQGGGATPGLFQALRDFEPGLLHVFTVGLLPAAEMAGVMHEAPTVGSLHAARVRLANRAAVRRATPAVGKSIGAQMIAPSSRWKQYLEEKWGHPQDWGLPKEQVDVVPLAVNAKRFRAPHGREQRKSRQQLGLEGQGPVVSLLGAPREWRGYGVLFGAAARLRAREIDVTILCAGSTECEGPIEEDGRPWAEVEAAAREREVRERLRTRSVEQMRPAIWASDVTVLPATKDLGGLQVARAMLCGVPPIRVKAKGAATDQIEDNTSGYVVPRGDEAALADRIERLVTSKSHRQAMSERAREQARGRYGREKSALSALNAYVRAGRRYLDAVGEDEGEAR